MTTIQGRTAVVTGGASGIGRGIAEALIGGGARVVIADISTAGAAATAAEIGAGHAHVDVADPASMAALADHVVATLGGVDIVVNNAGVGPSGAIEQMTLDDWRWLVDVNLFGVIHGVHAFLPILEGNPDGGHILNTSSMSAFAPMPGLGGYAVTKAGVTALTEVLARELVEAGSRVRATVLSPGPVATNIQDSQRHRTRRERSGLTEFVQPAPAGSVLDPRTVGEIAVDAIRHDRLYAVTHPHLWDRVAARNQTVAQAFGRS